jgi:hypothetical protein
MGSCRDRSRCASWDRQAARESRKRLGPDGELVFAQVAPGHPQSPGATLAAGYRPIGAEIKFFQSGICGRLLWDGPVSAMARTAALVTLQANTIC